MRALAAALVVTLASITTAGAQQAPADAPPVLIVDSDRLYQESRYGQQIRAELDRSAEELKAENDRIVAALTEEERSLTLRRPTMPAADFRKEATDFDTKVQGIRRARDAKEVALQNARLTAQKDFFAQVQGVVGQLMIEKGATVTFDQRSVFIALLAADITEEAIARIDAQFVDSDGSATGDVPALVEVPPSAVPSDIVPPATLPGPDDSPAADQGELPVLDPENP
ncbi:OmpH family outer membrane protein [Loktanella sp. R86503]|uniref:OmpH family outer membrane protein n=1 Tax=Loktanella TaxID=245186 RepID=UPI0036DCD1D6